MQKARCAVGVDRDGHSCHPSLRFEKRRSLLSFQLKIEEVLSRHWSLGRLERGKLVERSWYVQGGWNEGAAGRPWSPL
jgi:hypothetical protein